MTSNPELAALLASLPVVEDGMFDSDKEADVSMSNFDHTVDAGMEKVLKSGMWGRHAGWNFNARVRWDGERFHSQVWRFQRKVGDYYADTLEDLMAQVNDIFGWE